MAGYSGTPLAKKLGIKPGCAVHVVAGPDDYARGHLVYFANGPLLLIRTEDVRTLDLRAGDSIAAATARRLTRTAAAPNRKLGDPSKKARA